MHTPPSSPMSSFFSIHLAAFLFLLTTTTPATSSSPLSTVTMAKASSTTIICALLPTASLRVDLNCTAAAAAAVGGGGGRRQRNYPSSKPFAAVAGGNGFLCALGPSLTSPEAGNHTSMRWWELSKNGTEKPPKRVYLGPRIAALSSGGERVCGVLAGGRLHCWRWRGLRVPAEVEFSDVAVGGDFVCGMVTNSGAIRCFGDDSSVVGNTPLGSYAALGAAARHACAVSTAGELVCWGAGAPHLGHQASAIGALALGEDGVCGLHANGKVVCFGDASPPPGHLADDQFVGIQAHGGTYCGILMANYSLVCWGNNAFDGNHLVFGRVLPGPCAPMSSCHCGVLPGSADLCGDGGCICVDCAFVQIVSAQSSQSTAKTRAVWIVVAVVAFLAFLVALLFLFSWWRRHRHRHHAASSPMDEQLRSVIGKAGLGSAVEQFALGTLEAATDGFSDSRRIGSGSFGSVYRGTLADGRDVAIKRAEDFATASTSSARPVRRRDRESAFCSELTALSRANHKNIVRLLGCSVDAGERVLVYEFMSNGTLHDQLHKRSPLAPPLASWRGRLTIALDAARGIEYMHTYTVPPIIHRDIKSSNILLDECWTAKIADFGLSSVLKTGTGDCDEVREPLYTAGTVGYMDPEYYRLQHLTEKSDVYSFGVVLLELISGCKVVQRYAGSVTPKNVVEFALPHIVADEVARALDPRLPPPTPNETEALAYVGYLAADCVGSVGCDRPTMTEVVDGLERAVGACIASLLSQSGAIGPTLSRSGTDQFDLTD